MREHISFKPEGEEDKLGSAHGVAAAEPADGDGGGRAEQGQDGEGDGEGRPPRVVGRVQCHGLSNVIRCDFIEAACILEEDHYLHEVEDEVRRADECPGPKVADPHGAGVRLHRVVVVGGAVQCLSSRFFGTVPNRSKLQTAFSLFMKYSDILG